MKPSRIRVVVIEENEHLRSALADFLCADALMDIVGCCRSGAAWLQAAGPDAADVAVLGLSGSGAADRENLRGLQKAGIQTIAIARTDADAQRYRELAGDMLFMPAGGTAASANELYTRLRYQIRNARLAQAVEKGGFQGAWRVFPGAQPKSCAPALRDGFRQTDIRLIAIGASAGGTQALMELLPTLPPDMPAIVLVQHMPAAFVGLFASHLRGKCQMRVCLAAGGEQAAQGTIYMTALDRHLTVLSRGGQPCIVCEEGAEESGIRPSVDKLFFSASALGARAIGVILTGMGTDGAKGLLAMREAGAYTIGQDEKSCVVYGMPQAAYKLGAVVRQLPLDQISPALQRQVF